MNKELRTRIHIDASPEKVWQILSDFDRYPEWNPFVKKISGRPEVGKTIQIQLPGMGFRPQVIVFEPVREFRWKGKLLFTGLFDGEHYFILEENPDGSTTFIHGEKFSGILLPLLAKSLDGDTKNGFEAMNQALKTRCEEA
ncbi:MAG: SRPBCC family protein [Flavobacteriales bacterium]